MSIFHGEDGFFGPPKVQEAYNIIFFLFLMENSILKMFGSVDFKITPAFCSQAEYTKYLSSLKKVFLFLDIILEIRL